MISIKNYTTGKIKYFLKFFSTSTFRVCFEFCLFIFAHFIILYALFKFNYTLIDITLSLLWSFTILIIGQEAGAHRLFSHLSYRCSQHKRIFIHLLIGFSNYGSSIDWAFVHQIHHKNSDTFKDPTSPLNNSILEIFSNFWKIKFLKLLPDASDKRFILKTQKSFPESTFFHKYNLLILTGWGFILFLTLPANMAILYYFLPMLIVSYSLNSINYFCHSVQDQKHRPKNVFWINLYTLGSGWHANHHAYPGLKRFSEKFDFVAWIIENILMSHGLKNKTD